MKPGIKYIVYDMEFDFQFIAVLVINYDNFNYQLTTDEITTKFLTLYNPIENMMQLEIIGEL